VPFPENDGRVFTDHISRISSYPSRKSFTLN